MILCQRQVPKLHLYRYDNDEQLSKTKGTDPTATIVYHRSLGRVRGPVCRCIQDFKVDQRETRILLLLV
jgi:hypothetical protein